MIWEGNYGVALNITKQQANIGFHSGNCDQDIDALAKIPVIRRQLNKLDPEKLRLELKSYGAWDEKELSDHKQNLDRILWLACADIVDNNV